MYLFCICIQSVLRIFYIIIKLHNEILAKTKIIYLANKPFWHSKWHFSVSTKSGYRFPHQAPLKLNWPHLLSLSILVLHLFCSFPPFLNTYIWYCYSSEKHFFSGHNSTRVTLTSENFKIFLNGKLLVEILLQCFKIVTKIIVYQVNKTDNNGRLPLNWHCIFSFKPKL